MEDILEVEKQRVVYYKDRLDKESQKVDKLLKLLEESNIPVPQDVKEDNYDTVYLNNVVIRTYWGIMDMVRDLERAGVKYVDLNSINVYLRDADLTPELVFKYLIAPWKNDSLMGYYINWAQYQTIKNSYNDTPDRVLIRVDVVGDECVQVTLNCWRLYVV